MTNIVVRRKPVATVNPWNEMDRMWESFFDAPLRQAVQEPRKPKVNVSEEENGLSMSVELPGFGAEDLNIEIKENLLIIRALHRAELNEEGKEEERKTAFERSFVLSEEYKRDGIKADMKNGLLTLELPRKEKPAPLSIKVNG
ncbi:MAG: hypothetical protein B6241_14995 [Spirochaetaceae bacterium 4572_59]|nr:MAG: hypothetical protein B6241_14995 [Spirochaetaceae bacterium 4572_59]